MELLHYLIATLVGLVLGLIGGGGSILTVPILVYIMGINPLEATTSSLFIIGLTSFIGGISSYKRGFVDFKSLIEFGIPSIFSIFIVRQHVLPHLPDTLFSVFGVVVSKNLFLMLLFAVLIVASSLTMILKKNATETKASENNLPIRHKTFVLIFMGMLVGIITGLLGAGGGFLIIPVFVILLKLSMRKAIGTSLMIIGINSLFGFMFSIKHFQFNWKLILLFTAFSIIGVLIGSRFSYKVPAALLKKMFGWFLLLIGVYIIGKEVFKF